MRNSAHAPEGKLQITQMHADDFCVWICVYLRYLRADFGLAGEAVLP